MVVDIYERCAEGPRNVDLQGTPAARQLIGSSLSMRFTVSI